MPRHIFKGDLPFHLVPRRAGTRAEAIALLETWFPGASSRWEIRDGHYLHLGVSKEQLATLDTTQLAELRDCGVNSDGVMGIRYAV